MSLMICPDCGHEVSTEAKACPNCAHPFVVPRVSPKVIVENTPPEENGLPNWAFVLMGIAGVILIFAVFVFMNRSRDEETANRSINVDVASKRNSTDPRETPKTQTVNVPAATDSQPVNVPSTTSSTTTTSVPSVPSTSKTITSVPSETTDKGVVLIDAKITNLNGAIQNVKAEKFYLLDESLDSILTKADLEPIAGQSLVNSFGLSVLYPSRYADFNRDALNAIKSHIKYTVLTDSAGKAQIKDVKTDSYYLFGVTKSGNAFAVWDSPVSILSGQNVLSLSPQKLTEVDNNVEEEEEE